MAPKNPISGLALINMLGTGRIIKKMVSGFSTMKMGISMKEVGLIIKDMAKEPIGYLILRAN